MWAPPSKPPPITRPSLPPSRPRSILTAFRYTVESKRLLAHTGTRHYVANLPRKFGTTYLWYRAGHKANLSDIRLAAYPPSLPPGQDILILPKNTEREQTPPFSNWPYLSIPIVVAPGHTSVHSSSRRRKYNEGQAAVTICFLRHARKHAAQKKMLKLCSTCVLSYIQLKRNSKNNATCCERVKGSALPTQTAGRSYRSYSVSAIRPTFLSL